MGKRTGKIIQCTACGKDKYWPLSQLKRGGKYCSTKCYLKLNRNRQAEYNKEHRHGKIIKCTECGKEIYRHPTTLNRLRCSKKCANAFISKLYKSSPDKMERAGQLYKFVDHSDPIARANNKKGHIKYFIDHPEAGKNISIRVKQLYKDGKLKPKRGKDSPWWKGGISTLQNLERQKSEYKEWRKAVYKRDGYKCQMCGTNINLHAHHKKEFAQFPGLRYEVSNGLTVCQICHGKIHGRPIPNIGQVNKKIKTVTNPLE